MKIIDEIAAERQRQVDEEGYTAEHDDTHINGEIANAASDYALPGQNPASWSWAKDKSKHSRRDQLIKAGALIIAEIERLDRVAQQQMGIQIGMIIAADRRTSTWRLAYFLRGKGFLVKTAQVLKACKKLEEKGVIKRNKSFSSARNYVWELASTEPN